MDARKRILLRQRLQYLLYGNYHGVSANWLTKQMDSVFSNVKEFSLHQKCPVILDSLDIDLGEQLFNEIIYQQSGTNFGKNFDCESGLATFLYAYVVKVKPSVVVETGVANGITTNVLMRALEKTGGVLHSFDVDARTKNVYSGSGQWEFHLLKNNLERDLQHQVSKIGKVDLWIHDSNHGYKWQAFEYELARESLNSDGLVVSDDVDASTAWGLASKSFFRNSFGVFDKRKFFGVATI